MKKRIKGLCAAIILPLALGVSGCFNSEITDEQGKNWAVENGYEKKEVIGGEYEFSHVVVKGDHVRTYVSCPTSGTEEYDELYGFCDSMQGATLKVISENKIEAKIGTETETAKFVVDEDGYLFVTDKTQIKTESYIKYLLKDGKIFIVGEDSTSTDGDYTYTIVFTKK